MLRRRCFALVLGALWFAHSLEAQVVGKIAGTVVDATTKEPLVLVNVAVAGTTYGAVTDVAGEYFILNVPVGTYRVTASHLGYQKVTQLEAIVMTGKTTRVDFALTAEAIQQDEVIVQAVRPPIVKDRTSTERIVNDDAIRTSFVRSIPEALETQTGVFQGLYRGSSQVQSTILLNNVSLNSGLTSDNYVGVNLSTIQEIAVLTGGYNAEYGRARSAIVSVSTKEGYGNTLNGSFLARLRPAGKYHFGRYMYSQENYDWTHYDLSYWTQQSQSAVSPFYGMKPDSLLGAWHQQITPNDTLGLYNQRDEWEFEGTLYGALSEDLGYLLSARYKRGVGIFPQVIPYNTEFNIQGNLRYDLSPDLKLRFSGLYGGWESAVLSGETNFNSLESARESQWLAPMVVENPYDEFKYSLKGGIERQWPELRRWTNMAVKLTHVLNPSTFYEVQASYLKDKMDRSDRYNSNPNDYWTDRDDVRMMVSRFLLRTYFHFWDKSESDVYEIKADLSSQVNFNNLIKAGAEFRVFDFSYQHWMSQYEGGRRWNLNNAFEGTPYEGSVYIQDKMEFEGLVMNLGLRGDLFAQSRMAPENMFDPLAFQITTPGHDPAEPNGIPGTPVRVATKIKTAISPRIGISHPITEETVLRFFYGHFYQRPSWTKMFGFPFINYSENEATVFNAYAKQTTYMDQWQGYYGNPDLDFERTIQYEIGVDHLLTAETRLTVTGYYKDASNEARSQTQLFAGSNSYNRAIMITNDGLSDVRGLETEVESRVFDGLTVGISHDVYWSTRAGVGFTTMYEPYTQKPPIPRASDLERASWTSINKVKSWVNYVLAPNAGPELAGIRPLGDVSIYVYAWWRQGEPYTYHSPGDVSTEPNNRRWFSIYEVNAKLKKGFRVGVLRCELSLEARNLLNSKFYRLFGGSDLRTWIDRTDLPERDRLPKHGFSGEPNEWNWYTYEVPPRQVTFQLRIDF